MFLAQRNWISSVLLQAFAFLSVLRELCGEVFLSTAVPQQGNDGFFARRSVFIDRGALNGCPFLGQLLGGWGFTHVKGERRGPRTLLKHLAQGVSK